MYISKKNKFLSFIYILFTFYFKSINCFNNQTYFEELNNKIINENEKINHIFRRENEINNNNINTNTNTNTNGNTNISTNILYSKVIPLLKAYKAKVNGVNVELARIGNIYDGGYVVPVEAMKAADVLMGYGIDIDISFERDFTQRYNKPSYGFDCGVEKIATGNDRCYFLSECLGTSDYLYNKEKSSGNIFTFSEQIERLRLTDKKIAIKMDIEGAEFVVMDDILKNQQNITSIVIEVHFKKTTPENLVKFLSSINEHFLLLHIHGNNFSSCKKGEIPTVIELTYINKNLVSSYQVSDNQKYPLQIDRPNFSKIPDCEFEIKYNELDYYLIFKMSLDKLKKINIFN